MVGTIKCRENAVTWPQTLSQAGLRTGKCSV